MNDVATDPNLQERIEAERERIREEYARRENEVDAELYDEGNPVERWFIDERQAVAKRLLGESGLETASSWKVLEIGVGRRGWIPELLAWGVREENILGIDLDDARVEIARNRFPKADLRTGDATALPWTDELVDIVIASTVFSSVLDVEVRKAIANEMVRVLKPGGAVVWYDMRVGNPSNPNVKGIGKSEIRELFETLDCKVQSVTLIPPLARRIFSNFELLAKTLLRFPFLRSHYVGVFRKN
jgi:ubiquinone/menaquinone biosynthesis C-methylase UbiE